MARAICDDDFNADSRAILMKAEIYFDGDNADPLTVTVDNYLISIEGLEESGMDSDWPLGDVSANELFIELYNTDGMFSPTNSTGPYFGKITTGIKVIPYFKPATTEVEDWEQLGEFFVTDWQAAITAFAAQITAHDDMHACLTADNLEIAIVKDITYKAFYESFFSMLNTNVAVSSYFENDTIPWIFRGYSNADLVQQITSSAFGICMGARTGGLEVNHISAAQTLRATLTDQNQVIDIASRQSITQQYKKVNLTYNKPQLKPDTQVLNLYGLEVPPGTTIHEKMRFSADNIYQLTNINVLSESVAISVTNYNATPYNIILTTFNGSDMKREADIKVYGTVLEKVDVLLGEEDTSGNTLILYNSYIQTADKAESYKQAVEAAIDSSVPELTVPIRGNLLLKVGDKVRIVSEFFKLDYVGIIKRSTYSYNGALTGELTLLDASIFGL